jgi:hypothetical protein
MERLHPAAEHLGSASKILYLRHLDAFAGEQLRGASGREQLDPQAGEAAGELDDAGLVGYREQGTGDGHARLIPRVRPPGAAHRQRQATIELRQWIACNWALAVVASVEEGAAPGAERLAVLAAPTLTLRLRKPAEVFPVFGKARRTTALALQVDDPAALRAALAN